MLVSGENSKYKDEIKTMIWMYKYGPKPPSTLTGTTPINIAKEPKITAAASTVNIQRETMLLAIDTVAIQKIMAKAKVSPDKNNCELNVVVDRKITAEKIMFAVVSHLKFVTVEGISIHHPF